MTDWKIFTGDALTVLKTLDSESIQCVVTSPPYYNLRDYGIDGQIGKESCPDCLGWATGNTCGECYICHLVAVMREVRRALRCDGTLWLNIGDSYSRSGGWASNDGLDGKARGESGRARTNTQGGRNGQKSPDGIPEKNLLMIPARLALALQADGWFIRSENIWAKKNPMPDSAKDRTTRSHEQIYMLTKNNKYFYDHVAVREPNTESMLRRAAAGHTRGANGKLDVSRNDHSSMRTEENKKIATSGRNLRDVWILNLSSFHEAHFATFPPALPEICIKAGSREGDIVLDPFSGAGTTGLVAVQLGRQYIGIELNPDYVAMSEARIKKGVDKIQPPEDKTKLKQET